MILRLTRLARRFASRLGAAVVALCLTTASRAAADSFTFDGSQTNQIIDGFGVNANYYAWNTNDLPPVLDALKNEAGMTLFRVIFVNDWESSNDNDDADVMDWDYYNSLYSDAEFQKLWDLIRYLNQQGVTNGVVLNFQGKGPDWMGGGTLADGYEDEWAEMIASLLVYARNTQHLDFRLVAPNNEPNLESEGIHTATAAQYVTALHKLADKLDANGLGDVRFVAPDLAYGGTDYLAELASDPAVMAKLAHFGVHSYADNGGGSVGVADFIAAAGYADRTLWVTEFNVWCDVCEVGAEGTNSWDYALAGAHYLFSHLDSGASAGLVWEGFDSFYPHHNDWSFWGLLGVDDPEAELTTYTKRKEFYTLAQIAKFVRPGARMIGVDDPGGSLYVLGFYHDELGQLTIVGINESQTATGLSGNLASLPAIPGLDFYYTTATTNLYQAASVAVASDHTFALDIPGDCIFTLTGFDPAKTAVSLAITNPPDLARVVAPADILIEASASTTTGTLSTVTFYSGTNLIGQADSAPYSLTWSNVPPGNYLLTARATNSVGYFAVSPAVRVNVFGPLAQIALTPTNVSVVVSGMQQFQAIAADSLGAAVNPKPEFAWSVSGGGSIDSNGLFTAGASLGGPYAVRASSGSITGATPLSIIASNLAPMGVGYTWYSLTSPSDDTPSAAAPRINDGDLNTDVHLLPDTGEDVSDAYEAAGVVWSTTQSIDRVVYKNGSFNAIEDGVFAAEFALQFSPDGATWTDAGPVWTVTPAYTYNSADSANMSFTFTGGVALVRGVRCVGRVHTAESSPPPNSWVAFAKELQAFATIAVGPPQPPPVLRASPATNGVAIWWPAAATNYVVESATNVGAPTSWAPITNTPETVGQELRLIIAPGGARQFFRLRSPP